MTEVVYDPREDLLIVTMSTESVVMVSSEGQVVKSIDIKDREIALGDDGYFAFHFMEGQHKIGYLNKDLELVKNYNILWQDWNSIAWCDNLVPNVYGTEVYLTCSPNDAQDVIIFQGILLSKNRLLDCLDYTYTVELHDDGSDGQEAVPDYEPVQAESDAEDELAGDLVEQDEQDPEGPAGNTRSKRRCNCCYPSHCNLSFHTMGSNVRSYTSSKVNPMDGELRSFAVDLDVTEKEELTDHIREGMLGAKADSITMLRDSAS